MFSKIDIAKQNFLRQEFGTEFQREVRLFLDRISRAISIARLCMFFTCNASVFGILWCIYKNTIQGIGVGVLPQYSSILGYCVTVTDIRLRPAQVDG